MRLPRVDDVERGPGDHRLVERGLEGPQRRLRPVDADDDPAAGPDGAGRLVPHDEHGAAGVGDDLHGDGTDAGAAQHAVAHRPDDDERGGAGRVDEGLAGVPVARDRRDLEAGVGGVGTRDAVGEQPAGVVLTTDGSEISPNPIIGRSGANAWSTWSVMPRALATCAARVTAAMDSGDPSTPTTTRGVLILDSSDRESGSRRRARREVLGRRRPSSWVLIDPTPRPWHGACRGARARARPRMSCTDIRRVRPPRGRRGVGICTGSADDGLAVPEDVEDDTARPEGPVGGGPRGWPRRPSATTTDAPLTDAPDGARTRADPAASPRPSCCGAAATPA